VPLRVAIVNDHELVVRGLRAMLAPYSERIRVVELEVGRDVRNPVDIALYDTFTQQQLDGAGIAELVDDPDVGAVVVYTWNMHPDLVAKAREHKVRGYVSKHLPARRLVEALLRVAAGAEVVEPSASPSADAEQDVEAGDWPGREHGLTQRQAEVVALITQGLTNQEIIERTYITLNTLKTYIRQAYQRMGVTTRAQAVLWGVEHGMMPQVVARGNGGGNGGRNGRDNGGANGGSNGHPGRLEGTDGAATSTAASASARAADVSVGDRSSNGAPRTTPSHAFGSDGTGQQ
jgi:DNA-binding NarL/FixJ family response regulator